jgi:hypothetical protein
MYEYMKCLGLEQLIESEDATVGLISHILTNGKPIVGYSNGPYINHAYGYAEFIARTKINHENKEIEFAGLDVHCSGSCSWNLRIAIDITPDDWEPTRRRLVCKNAEDGNGLIVINVVNSDVLPSFLEDDPLRLQMIAFPLSLGLYENEDLYAEDQPTANALGKKFILGEGSLFPVGFMNNHSVAQKVNVDEGDKLCDDVMLIRGKIKRLSNGKVKIDDKEYNLFIDCIIETLHGDLEVVFTFDQIPEEKRALLKAGSILTGSFVLSGDAAIKEYREGFVRDEEHHLALLRHTFLCGQAERLQFVLSENVSYRSDISGKAFQGKADVIAYLNEIHKATKGKYSSYFATTLDMDSLTSSAGNSSSPGRRCIVLSYNQPDNYDSIAFIDLDSDANIQSIYLADYGQYKVEIDKPFVSEFAFRDFTLPEFSGDSMILRASFHGMIDPDTKKEDVYQAMRQNPSMDMLADMVIDSMQVNHIDCNGTSLENVFSFVFSKSAVETAKRQPIDVSRYMSDFLTVVCGSSNPGIPESLEKPMQERFGAAIDMAKQFQKDFILSEGELILNDPACRKAFHDALMTVQQLGVLFASYHLK